MTGARREPGRTVTSKAFAILDVFDAMRAYATLTDICEHTGLPPSTALRLARELVACGALERLPDGRYAIGLRLWERASVAARSRTVREAALPSMQDLYESTHENVQLAVLDGDEAVVVEKIAGSRTTEIWSRVGGRLPLHSTGIGKVLMAHLPPDRIEALLRSGLRRYTPRTVVMPGRVLAGLDRIRSTGLAVNHEEMQLGRSSLAAAVVDADGVVVASIGVGGRSSGFDAALLAPRVLAAAQVASGRLQRVPQPQAG